MYEIERSIAARKAEAVCDWATAAEMWAKLEASTIVPESKAHFKLQKNACLMLLEARTAGDKLRQEIAENQL